MSILGRLLEIPWYIYTLLELFLWSMNNKTRNKWNRNRFVGGPCIPPHKTIKNLCCLTFTRTLKQEIEGHWSYWGIIGQVFVTPSWDCLQGSRCSSLRIFAALGTKSWFSWRILWGRTGDGELGVGGGGGGDGRGLEWSTISSLLAIW